MRLAIVNLTGGGLSGGYRKYLSRIMPILLREIGPESLASYTPGDLQPTAGDPRGLPLSSPSGDGLLGHRALKQQLASFRPDVVFVPTARWIGILNVPTVVMVQNLEPVEVPFGGNPLWESLKNLLRAAQARHACRRADRVIAISRHVKDVVVSRWGVREERIDVVYLGVDAPGTSPPPRVADAPGLAGVTPGAFLFTAGSIRPARGLEDLIGAAGRLAPPVADIQVVIAGRVDPGMGFYAKRMARLAREASIDRRLIWAGDLSERDMAWAYANGSVFVMTSRVEACPNTALEAMSHGCVSVVPDHPPLPELFGEAALYYRAGDDHDLAARLIQALRLPPPERDAMRTAALQRAGRFTWEATASHTLEALRKAAVPAGSATSDSGDARP